MGLRMSSKSNIEGAVSASADDVAIRIEGLSKRFAVYHTPLERLKHVIAPKRTQGFSEFWALSGVDLTIRRGETCAIVGRNGSGKSTLLQILCGTLRGTTGRVEVNGRVAALLELGAGFNVDFTGRENVYMNGAVMGLSREEIDSRFEQIEAFAEIGNFIDQPVKTYSSGMYVRLAFAVAIHVDPQILIVDEALAVGDSRFQAKCLNRIKQMQAKGVTILFVSHDVGAVRSLCERALWLDKGRVRMMGDAFSVTAQYSQYLFADEPSAEDKQSAAAQTDAADDGEQADAASHGVDDAVELMATHRPINHWGSHVGSILEAGIYNAAGERISTIAAFEEIEVRIKVCPPANADRTTLSVACSLKDLRGTDLIVSTTWDHAKIDFRQAGETAVVRFKMKNRLNGGDYLLTVALEDRAGAMPQYYEYIEGAHYFKSLAEDKLYGVFLPDVEQSVESVNGSERSATRTIA
ncbi:ABC transporter ATP-binding protein [Burkholderia sp. Ac-20345]|uniref:ABC transporter ATP-binding protein n=1 Tax=Burkholderia sp. Ac-20345 TaxID=2703891 RepID=UPI001F11A887|nr:ABC transporter ATP-binding protein [Burkholderia sp. Ac-20345]